MICLCTFIAKGEEPALGTGEQPNKVPAELEPHFRFLYDQLKETYVNYTQYVVTTTSAILLIIGWLLTSKDARAYISKYPRMKTVMVGAIVIFWAIEIVISWGAFQSSNKTKQLLEPIREALAKDYEAKEPIQHYYWAKGPFSITQDYYLPKVIQGHGVIIFVTAHAVLYVVLGLIIWSISAPKSVGHHDRGDQ
jgi:hypothetical protein